LRGWGERGDEQLARAEEKGGKGLAKGLAGELSRAQQTRPKLRRGGAEGEGVGMGRGPWGWVGVLR